MAIKPQDMIQIAKSVQSKQQKPKSLEERVRERAREARKTNLLDQAQLNTFEQDSKDYEQRLSRLQQRYDNDEYVDPNEVKDILNRGKALENRATAYETYLKDYAPDQKDALYTASKIKDNYANQLNGLDGVQKFYGQFENADAFNTYAANKKREDYLINEYDLAKGKAAVDAAEQEMNRLASTHGNALKNPIYRATVGKVFGNEAIDDYTAAKDRYDELVAEYNQAQKLQQLASYDDVKKNSDFASKSVAGDDLLSKFINMDEKDRKSTDVWTSILGGIAEGRGVIGSIADVVGLQNSELNDLVDKYHSMTDDEKKVFNYINNTQGAVAARQYLYDIGEGLSLRAAGQQKNKLDKILPDNWVGDATGGLLAFDNAINSGVSNAFSSFGEGIYQAFAQNDKVQNTAVSANRLGLDREETNAVGKVLLDLAQSTGNMIPSIVLSSVTGVPILGSGMMGVQAKGSAYNQAIKEGMTPQQAQTYSTVMGALEGGLSYALTGIGKGATKLIKPLGTAIDGISDGFLRAIASFGVEAAGEALEEGLTEFFDPLVKNLVTGSDESVNWNDVGYSALLGFLSGGLLEGTPAAIRAYSLPDATAESFKTHYDTGDGFEDFSNNVFKDDTLLSLQVIELVKDGKPEEAVSALNKGLRNYRYAKEYAKQKYGVKSASEIDKRIQTIETLKASIKAGKFNAQSAATALRNSSDVWQIAAQNNDTVVQALLDGDLTNSKIENKILNDRGTKIAFRRKTGVDLDQLPTVSKKRQAARATSQVYKAFVNTDAYRNMQEKTKANETESDAAVRVQNKRSIIDGMLALGNQSLNEAKEARKNGDVALAEEKETMARLANTAIQNTRKNTGSTYFATNDAVGVVIFDELKGLGEKYLSGLDEADRRYLTDVRSIKALSDAERSVKERLNNQREAATKKREKSRIDRQIDAVDAYYASAVMAFQNARDAMDADFSNVVDERIKTMNKRLGRYGITVEGFSNGLRYLDANGNEISYQEAMRRQQSGEQVSATMLRGMQSARTIQIARDVAKGVVPVMNPITGKIEQLRIGNGPGMISAERAVDVILGHEAVHYAMKYGKGDLVNQVLNHVAGTKIDTEYEIDNRRNNKPVSKEAEERWNRLKDTYAKEVAKEKNISVEEALKQVDDRYLYEEIACDYVGSVAAYQDFANLLASQNRNLFMRIVESIRNLVNALRNGGKNHSAKAAEDLSKRLASIADKHYGKYEKTIKNDAAQNTAESPESNVSAEEGTNEDDAANEGDAQEKADKGAETEKETVDGEIEKRYSVGESSNFDSVYDEYLQARDSFREAKRLYNELTETEEHKAAIEKLHSAKGLDALKKAVSVYKEYEESSGLADAFRKMKALEQHTEELRKRSEELQKQEAAQKEADAIKKSGLEPSEYRRKEAVKEFGYTPYFYDAGYLLPNGKLLNFSGEKGKHFGSRGQDHRAIGVIYENVESGSSAMLAFMGDGNIRVMAETPGIDIAYGVEPSKEQYEVISRFAQSAKKNGFFSIDITDKKGNTVANLTYEDSFSPVRIVNDIKHYFETGEVREQSTISQFRYSVSEEMDLDYLSAVERQDMEKAQSLVDEAAARSGYSRRMYHGSKNGGGFTVFRDWGYFTENRDYAQRYAQRENEKSLYEVYVKMDQPFDTRDPDTKEIFEENIRPEYGTSEIQDSGLPDWTDGYDIADYIDENDLDFDSIVLDEGGDMVNGQPVSRGLSYVVKHSAQVKSADPVTYDDNGNVIPLSERFNEKESDIRYSVAGVNSLDADFGEFDRALQMYQKGDSKNDIVRETGWWLGKDGKWRYEISDKDIDFDRNGFVKNPTTVGDYVKHDKLFKAYPQLRDIRVEFVNRVGNSDSAKGAYAVEKKTILIKKSVVETEAKEIILHELQHAIQHAEGFKRGSSKKTGGMLVFNEIYRRVKNYPRFQDLKSTSDKFNYVKAMADIEGGSSFDLLARGAYLNDHGELEARKTVERMNLSPEKLRGEPYFNDGIVLDNDLIKQKFLDNLLEIGYNRKQASQIAEEEFFNDYQRKDGSQLDDARNAGHEGQGTGHGRRNVSGNYDLQNGRQRQVHGAGEISVSDASTEKNGNRSGHSRVNQEPSGRYSVSGEFSLDDGAESYDKLKRQIAEQKEKIHRLTMEMTESHGSHLDVKETGRFLHELLDRYGATLTVKGVERDFNDITEYLYRQYEIERDDQGNFLSKKKVKSVDADKLQGMIQRLASRIMESAVDVDAQYDSYVAFLKTVHDTTVGITPEIKEAFGDGWNRFRQSNFGRMNLRNAETSDLDAFYHELADQYPEILDETVTEPVEQLKAIAEAAKTIRETGLDPKNIYGVDGESVVADIAYDISEGIATIDREMNFADKAKQKVQNAKEEGERAVLAEGRRGDFRVADQRLADDMYYGKKIASIRNRYEAKMDAMAEHFATKIKNRSEAQQARYQKKMVEKRCLDLAKRLAKPTKDKHVPDEMVADVYRLLKQIQLPLKNKADADTNLKISQFLETVQKRYGDEKLKPSDGVGFPEALKKDIEAFTYRSMDDMTAQQLHGLNELVRRAQFAISNFDKAFHSGEKISVESLKAFDHFRDSRGKKGKFGFGHTIVDFVMHYAEDPEAFFSILDVPELTEAYHRIADGQNKLAQNVKNLTNDLSDIVGENGVPKSWREQATPYTVSTGVTLHMTPAQLMTLYLYSKQTDSYKCLINDNGGIAVAATNHKIRLTDKNGRVVETNDFKKLKNLKDVRHIETGSREIGNMTSLNQAMLDELLGHLTDEQRAMADKISAHLNTTVADMANETSLETEGYRKYVMENYFPMAVFDRNKSVDEVFRDMHGQIMTEGFTKERSGLSGKKLIVDDIFSVVNRHDVAVAQYNAYKKALLDYRKLLTIRPNGESSLESQIFNYFGVGNKNRVNDFLNNFALDVQGVQMATGEETLLSEKFLRNYKAAQVAANLSVVVKQPTSIIRALPEFSADAIKVMVKPVDPKTVKADIAEMQEHSGLAFFKANGYSEYANARGFEELYNKNAFTLRDNFDNAMSWGAEQMDLLTWSAIWRAAKADTNTIEEATDKFNEVIRKTQVVDTALTSSRVTRQNGLFKMAFAFKNEPLKNINYIRTTLNDYAVGKEGSGKKLAKVLAASGINTLINAAITAAVSMLRDDEKGTIEEFFDKTSDNFLYGVASDTLVFAGDVWEAIEAAMSGKTVERMDLAAITDIVEIMIDAFEYFGKPESERKETPLKILHNLSKAISGLTGIPISNFSRALHTFGSLLGGVVGDPWFDYLLATRYYNAEGVDNTQVKKKFRSILTDALNKGDYKGFAKVAKELRSKGFSESDVQKAIAASDIFYDSFNKGPSEFTKEVNALMQYDKSMNATYIMSTLKGRKTDLINDLFEATKLKDKKAVKDSMENLLKLRDVESKRVMTEKEIYALLEKKLESQLKSDVKSRLVDLYMTDSYEDVRRLILKEYQAFGVTADDIDKLVRSMR